MKSVDFLNYPKSDSFNFLKIKAKGSTTVKYHLKPDSRGEKGHTMSCNKSEPVQVGLDNVLYLYYPATGKMKVCKPKKLYDAWGEGNYYLDPNKYDIQIDDDAIDYR